MPKTAFNGGFKWVAGVLGVVVATAGAAAVTKALNNETAIAVLSVKMDAMHETLREVRLDVKAIEKSLP
jgi:hypothetical protein